MEEQAKYEIKVTDRRPSFDDTPNLPAQASPNAVIMMAMQKGYSPELIKQMMDLNERYEANEARKAYHEAMAAFKADPPDIGKDKKVSFDVGNRTTSYTHASLANVTEKINRALSQHGLSAGWTTVQTEKGITVTCTITHKFGHSESTSLTAAPDTSGSKNAIQAVGSTVSYLERYTILALTGLATRDMDDDGKGTEVEYIDEKQLSQITDMIVETDADEDKFLEYMKIESLDKMPKSLFGKAMTALKAKKKKVQE